MNLALARIYRARGDNVQALNMMKRQLSDYSQMKPENAARRGDMFYPLAYWDIIAQSHAGGSLDPYQVRV